MTISITHAKDGHAVLNLNDTFDEKGNPLKNYALSSQYAPKKEAERIIKPEEIKKNNNSDIIVLFGCGNLALSELILKEKKNLPIIIVENILAVKHVFLDWIKIQTPNVFDTLEQEIFWFNVETKDEEIRSILKNHTVKQIAFFQNQKQIRIFETFYTNIKNRIINIHNERSANRSTFAKFEKLWLRNVTKNTSAIIKSYPLLATHNLGTAFSAVILGAGHSLDTALPSLKKYQKHMVIIACDTVVKVLLNHQIQPDIIVTIDPQKINAKYLENIPTANTTECILVCEPGVVNQGIRSFPNIMMFDSIFPYYTLLTKYFNIKGEIDIGGTVLTAAYQVARVFNFKHIGFVGMDFCFTEDSYHLKGSMYEEIFFSLLNRYQTFEMFFAKTINHDVIPTTNHLGDTVYTDKKFMLFKNWFEKKIAIDEPNCVNCSKGGLSIDKLPYMDFNKFIDTKVISEQNLSKKDLLTDLKNKINAYSKNQSLLNNDFQTRFTLFTKQYHQLIVAIKDYQKLLGKILKHIRNRQLPKVLQLQDQVLNSSAAQLAKPFVEIIIQKTLYQINQSTDKQDDTITALGHLYSELYNACKINLYYLEKSNFENQLLYQPES